LKNTIVVWGFNYTNMEFILSLLNVIGKFTQHIITESVSLFQNQHRNHLSYKFSYKSWIFNKLNYQTCRLEAHLSLNHSKSEPELLKTWAWITHLVNHALFELKHKNCQIATIFFTETRYLSRWLHIHH
jgi:hypothetical protein